MALKKSQPSERIEQIALVAKLRDLGYFAAAIPNGGKRDVREAAMLKREGVVAGVPDIFVLLEGGKIVWIEMKKRKGGRLSDAQKTVHAAFAELGHDVIVGLGAKDAFDRFKKLIHDTL